MFPTSSRTVKYTVAAWLSATLLPSLNNLSVAHASLSLCPRHEQPPHAARVQSAPHAMLSFLLVYPNSDFDHLVQP
jgi:hypothetical protein